MQVSCHNSSPLCLLTSSSPILYQALFCMMFRQEASADSSHNGQHVGLFPKGYKALLCRRLFALRVWRNKMYYAWEEIPFWEGPLLDKHTKSGDAWESESKRLKVRVRENRNSWILGRKLCLSSEQLREIVSKGTKRIIQETWCHRLSVSMVLMILRIYCSYWWPKEYAETRAKIKIRKLQMEAYFRATFSKTFLSFMTFRAEI